MTVAIYWHCDTSALTVGDIAAVLSTGQIRTVNIAASRIAGRKSSGDVMGLTGAEVLAILTGQAAAPFSWNGQNLTNTGTIRGASSLWWREVHMGGGKTKAGAAGATAVYPDANGPGGWGMDAEIEDVVDQFHIESDWDGASNPELEIYFQYYDDNTSGAVDDQLTFDLVLYYINPAGGGVRTQSLTGSKTIGQAAQYAPFELEIEIPYNPGGGNDLLVEDVFGMTLNLDVTNSVVSDGAAKVILNIMEFKYKTAWVQYEV